MMSNGLTFHNIGLRIPSILSYAQHLAIEASWFDSQLGEVTHNEFDESMLKLTSACRMSIQQKSMTQVMYLAQTFQ